MLEDMIKKLTEGEEKLNQLVEELKDKSYKAALMEGKYRKELAVEIEKAETYNEEVNKKNIKLKEQKKIELDEMHKKVKQIISLKVDNIM